MSTAKNETWNRDGEGEVLASAGASATQQQDQAKKLAEKAAQEAAKVKLTQTRKQIADLKAGPQTPEVKEQIALLEKQAEAYSKDAGENPIMHFAGNIFGGIKDFFADGKFNWKSLLGAGAGLFGMNALIGAMFGDGIGATILKFALAIPVAIFGGQLVNDWFGGDSKNDGQGNAHGQGPARVKYMSLNEYRQRCEEVGKLGGVQKNAVIFADTANVDIYPIVGDNVPAKGVVSLDVLGKYLSERSKGDPNQPIAINVAVVMNETRKAGVRLEKTPGIYGQGSKHAEAMPLTREQLIEASLSPEAKEVCAQADADFAKCLAQMVRDDRKARITYAPGEQTQPAPRSAADVDNGVALAR